MYATKSYNSAKKYNFNVVALYGIIYL